MAGCSLFLLSLCPDGNLPLALLATQLLEPYPFYPIGPELRNDRFFGADDLEGVDGRHRLRIADRRRPQRVHGTGLPSRGPPLPDQLRAGGHPCRRDRRFQGEKNLAQW